MKETCLTVSQLNILLNEALEHNVGQVIFEGEIHQITHAQSGHLYFTLKDQDSQVQGVMWRGSAQSLAFRPDQGLSVICYARPNVYQKSGRLQMVVYKMEPSGEGLLRKKFLALKEKLEKEGLFDPSRKRSLPLLPKAVGIVTSASGAAIHDMMTKIHERLPCQKVYLIDARVQGEGAAQEIAQAISRFNSLELVDVLIVGRGGGSLEDLWAFNEEVLVRAIFASKIPVVSGVGHEVDLTLSDLVADFRAPTPTAAAELVVPKRSDLIEKIEGFSRRLKDTDRWLQPKMQALDELDLQLKSAMQRILHELRLLFESFSARVKAIEPSHILKLYQARLREFEERLGGSSTHSIRNATNLFSIYRQRLNFQVMLVKIGQLGEKLDEQNSRLQRSVSQLIQKKRLLIDGLSSNLESLSHKRIMERGYAIVRGPKGLVKSAVELNSQDLVAIDLARGSFEAEVLKIEKD